MHPENICIMTIKISLILSTLIVQIFIVLVQLILKILTVLESLLIFSFLSSIFLTSFILSHGLSLLSKKVSDCKKKNMNIYIYIYICFPIRYLNKNSFVYERYNNIIIRHLCTAHV